MMMVTVMTFTTLYVPQNMQLFLDEYLAYRERHFEHLTPDSPLIREDFSTAGLIRQKPRHITSSTISTILIDKLNKISFRQVDHVKGCRFRKSIKVIHGFRKYLETQLLQSDVNYIVTKKLMNHDLKLEENYFRPSFEFILREYSKAIPALQIDPTARMARQISTLEEEKTEIQALRLELEKVKQAIHV